MSELLLEMEDLHVRYGAVEVLKGVGLQVRKGECVALIGANGAGKTTTLMAISGMAPVVGGEVRLDGKPIRELAPEQIVARGITQVPEGRRIFPRMTVKENLILGAGLGAGPQQAGRDLEKVFELFPILKERVNQLGGTLSGGEQQMLALGRGLMARPKLLLLDEPSLGLAPRMVTQLFEVIDRIHRSGVTILLVEQNAYQALKVAQSAVILQTGRVVLRGPAEGLREDPAVKKAYLGG